MILLFMLDALLDAGSAASVAVALAVIAAACAPLVLPAAIIGVGARWAVTRRWRR